MRRRMEQDGYAVDVAALRARCPALALVTVSRFLEQMMALAEHNGEP